MTMTDRLLTQGEVEHEIVRLSSLLEERTGEYADLCMSEAETDIAYKRRRDTMLMNLSVVAPNGTATEKNARIAMVCADEYAEQRLAEARTKSCKEALLSLRHQLDALRTLAANIRAQT
jgi:hypothetical protein